MRGAQGPARECSYLLCCLINDLHALLIHEERKVRAFETVSAAVCVEALPHCRVLMLGSQCRSQPASVEQHLPWGVRVRKKTEREVDSEGSHSNVQQPRVDLAQQSSPLQSAQRRNNLYVYGQSLPFTRRSAELSEHTPSRGQRTLSFSRASQVNLLPRQQPAQRASAANLPA